MKDFDRLAAQLSAELDALFERWPDIDPRREPVDVADHIRKMGQKANWLSICLGKALRPIVGKMAKAALRYARVADEPEKIVFAPIVTLRGWPWLQVTRGLARTSIWIGPLLITIDRFGHRELGLPLVSFDWMPD